MLNVIIKRFLFARNYVVLRSTKNEDPLKMLDEISVDWTRALHILFTEGF